jgi:hypothetical protein
MESRDTLGHPAEGLFPSAHPNWVARAKQSLPVMRRHPRTPWRVGQSQTRSRFLHVPSQPPGPSCVRAHGNAPLLPPMRRRELGGHPQTLGKGTSSLCTLLGDSCRGSIHRGPYGTTSDSRQEASPTSLETASFSLHPSGTGSQGAPAIVRQFLTDRPHGPPLSSYRTLGESIDSLSAALLEYHTTQQTRLT